MKRRAHIVQVIPGLAIGPVHGGAELFAARLALALNPAIYERTIYCLWTYGTEVEQHWFQQLRSQGVQVRYGGAVSAAFRRLIGSGLLHAANQLGRLQCDIIQTHTEPADLIGLLLKAAQVVPHAVRTCHNSLEWSFDRRIGTMMDVCAPWIFDYETAVSPPAARRLNERTSTWLRRRMAEFVPNVIDPQATLARCSTRDLRGELGIAATAPLLVSVGRLTHQKGFDLLIQAIAQARSTIPEIQVLIVGEGEQRQELEQQIAANTLQQHVQLLGQRQDVPDLLRIADWCVVPSRWEGLPTVIMEAMLIGCPVIGSTIDGVTTLIQHQQNGWLVPANAPAQLAHGIMQALQLGQRQRQQLTAQARQDVQAYTIEPIAQRYHAIYQQLLK